MTTLATFRVAIWLMAWTLGMATLTFGHGRTEGMFAIGLLLAFGAVMIGPFKPRESLAARLLENIPGRSAVVFTIGFIAFLVLTVAATLPNSGPAGSGIHALEPLQFVVYPIFWLIGVVGVLQRYADERRTPPAGTTA